MTAQQEIEAAIKRCMNMGVSSPWRLDYNNHQLAACIDNHTVCIDVELKSANPDYLSILHWLLYIARAINKYCDMHKVSESQAAQYWLERFLWRCDCICIWGHIEKGPIKEQYGRPAWVKVRGFEI